MLVCRRLIFYTCSQRMNYAHSADANQYKIVIGQKVCSFLCHRADKLNIGCAEDIKNYSWRNSLNFNCVRCTKSKGARMARLKPSCYSQRICIGSMTFALSSQPINHHFISFCTALRITHQFKLPKAQARISATLAINL